MSEERTEIGELGEFGLINRLTQNNETRIAGTIQSVGDDGAVIDQFGRQSVISTDLLIEDVHFDLMYTPLKHLGYKSVVVNLSDICAMNSTPTHITMSIGVSNRFSVEALDEFYEGVYAACQKYNVDLIGGDTTSSGKGFIISVTAIGEVTPDKYVLRSGAQKGDIICVTGDLGAAYLGLQLLEREKQIYLEHPDVQPDLQKYPYCVGRILKPEARTDIVTWLAEQGITPTSMMDVSDGVSSDVMHLCDSSNKGCILYEKKLPIHDEARELAYEFKIDPTMCALNGGEDYELLFTVSQEDYEKLVLNESISPIGYITEAEEGIKLETKGGNTHNLKAQGWNSLSNEKK
ncbi:MAG: thiamine-phosphate kinase [Chitinophagales bacterium]|nr:thiamine-phosphate kinase [Chitinophagaceae bacterium]MCB9065879.1 thiamine-phosphate kinase [Chitinophagales bacterium]